MSFHDSPRSKDRGRFRYHSLKEWSVVSFVEKKREIPYHELTEAVVKRNALIILHFDTLYWNPLVV